MKKLSIRWSLSLFFSLAVAGIVVVFGIVLILITRQQLLTRTDAALREELREILLEAELALRAERSPQQYRSSLSIIAEETNRLCRLADQLLTLSREDAGMVPPMRDHVPLHAVLSDLIQQLQPRAFERSVALIADGLQPCEVLGHDVRLRQVSLNLLENALKFTQANGSVRVRCEGYDEAVVCSEVNSGTTVVVTLPGRMLPTSMRIAEDSGAVLTAVEFLEMTV